MEQRTEGLRNRVMQWKVVGWSKNRRNRRTSSAATPPTATPPTTTTPPATAASPATTTPPETLKSPVDGSVSTSTTTPNPAVASPVNASTSPSTEGLPVTDRAPEIPQTATAAPVEITTPTAQQSQTKDSNKAPDSGSSPISVGTVHDLPTALPEIIPAVQASDVGTMSATPLTAEEWSTLLWDVAYDDLKDEEADLLLAYESRINQYLTNSGQPFPLHDGQSPVRDLPRADTLDIDRNARRTQMSRVIAKWLDESDREINNEPRENSDDSSDSDASDSNTDQENGDRRAVQARSIRQILWKTVQTFPHGSLPWVASCLALEVRTSPKLETVRT
ncbi:hypothetical protein QBC47DRAFT_406911 [Echria macrotheca]|uniref:NWD NACHT-NTPase N-terminal domain-containing protein n=1 Tax=Echria macrotheca TaxID=438768 RepID=A0AAJ0B2M7_9PEZI|nr:hypothetical protein QBC47DRAFT_406911 [Echria macrotheca]